MHISTRPLAPRACLSQAIKIERPERMIIFKGEHMTVTIMSWIPSFSIQSCRSCYATQHCSVARTTTLDREWDSVLFIFTSDQEP